LLFDDGRVLAAVPLNQTSDYKAARREDHSDEYAMPALWDMHVHFRGGEELIEANAQLLPQYPGYGITTVRDAGGDISDAVIQWRDDVAADTRIGPRIFTPLRKLDGADGFWPGSIPLVTSDDVAPAVESLQRRTRRPP
jgi:hypothetical protein